MNSQTQTTETKKPGNALVGTGVILIIIGAILAFLPLANDEPSFGSPAAFIIFIAGLIFAAFGFGRRVLGALEKR